MSDNIQKDIRTLGELLSAVAKDVKNPDRVVAQTDVSGLSVSTVLTSDMGYETAVLDALGAHPVQRYETLHYARDGHLQWVELLPKLTKIKRLGYKDLVPDEEHILVRRN